MSGDGWVNQIGAQAPKTRERAILVCSGKPRVADNICNQDRRELSGLAHRVPPAADTLAQKTARVCQNPRSCYDEAD
jgi:hypothetical protein